MILAVDTETTGVDFNHGTKPFAVTMCDDKGTTHWWEWDVDPLTRQPDVPRADLREVKKLIASADELVFQNAKFDIMALGTLDISIRDDWRWDVTHDTTVQAHLLDSKAPKSLDVLSIRYARTDIGRWEDRLHDAVQRARRLARKHRPDWSLAEKGRKDMPSAKGKGFWKADYWVPAALYKSVLETGDEKEGYITELYPEFETCLTDYARRDPEVTLAVFLEMRRRISERGYDKVYEHRRQQIGVFARMQFRGVTVVGNNLRQLKKEYTAESERSRNVCVNLAAGLGYDLDLSKTAAVNASLKGFVYDTLKMPGVPKPKAKTQNPSLAKEVIDHYLKDVLPPKSKGAAFFRALKAVRQRMTAVTYMKGYQRFWHRIPGTADSYILYPNINMAATDTLRASSKDPNEQNISKKEDFNLRYCFGPAPGREWWSMDAKNLELRLPAYKAGETLLIDLFERPDEAPYYGSNHMVNFAAVYPELWEPVLKEVGPERVAEEIKTRYKSTYYSWCKNGWFGIQYGAVLKADGWGTADRAFHKQGAHALLFSRLDKLRDYNRRWIDFANANGYVETMPDKTVDPDRGYPLVCTRTSYGGVLETVPLSYHIQGTAMQWTNKAMWRCDPLLMDWRRHGFDAWLIMQVHDELVFDLPRRADPRVNPRKSNLGRVKVLARLAEQGGDDIGVPTPVSIGYHPETYSSEIAF